SHRRGRARRPLPCRRPSRGRRPRLRASSVAARSSLSCPSLRSAVCRCRWSGGAGGLSSDGRRLRGYRIRRTAGPPATAAAVAPVARLARHRRPATVLWVVLGSVSVYFMVGYAYGPIFLSLIIAFFTAVLAGRRLAAWSSLGAGYVSSLWLNHLGRGHRSPS